MDLSLSEGKMSERKEGVKWERKTWTLKKKKSHFHTGRYLPIYLASPSHFLCPNTSITKEKFQPLLVPTMRPKVLCFHCCIYHLWDGLVLFSIKCLNRGDTRGLLLFTQLLRNRPSRGLAFEQYRSLLPFGCVNWQHFEIPFLMLAYANVFLSLK